MAARKVATCIVVNGPSSAGKSTLCAALQDELVEQGFYKVAFDDFLNMLSTKSYPHSYTNLVGGDTSDLISKKPHDGKAGWEYVDESKAEGQQGKAWTRLEFSAETERLMLGQHRAWACHLEMGTNLIIDAFLQDEAWASDLFAVIQRTGARVVLVGAYCNDTELERREKQRGDRPHGLACRSAVACHSSHSRQYEVVVHTDIEQTSDSVSAIVRATLDSQ